MNEMYQMTPTSARVESFEPYCVKVALEVLAKYQGDVTMQEVVNGAKEVLLAYFEGVLEGSSILRSHILPKKEGG